MSDLNLIETSFIYSSLLRSMHVLYAYTNNRDREKTHNTTPQSKQTILLINYCCNNNRKWDGVLHFYDWSVNVSFVIGTIQEKVFFNRLDR